MADRKTADGQTNMSDLMLEMEKTDTYILLTIDGGDVSVWSTLDSETDTALYLQGAAKAMVKNDRQ